MTTDPCILSLDVANPDFCLSLWCETCRRHTPVAEVDFNVRDGRSLLALHKNCGRTAVIKMRHPIAEIHRCTCPHHACLLLKGAPISESAPEFVARMSKEFTSTGGAPVDEKLLKSWYCFECKCLIAPEQIGSAGFGPQKFYHYPHGTSIGDHPLSELHPVTSDASQFPWNQVAVPAPGLDLVCCACKRTVQRPELLRTVTDQRCGRKGRGGDYCQLCTGCWIKADSLPAPDEGVTYVPKTSEQGDVTDRDPVAEIQLELDKARADLAQAHQALGLLSTLTPTVPVQVDNLVAMATEMHGAIELGRALHANEIDKLRARNKRLHQENCTWQRRAKRRNPWHAISVHAAPQFYRPGNLTEVYRKLMGSVNEAVEARKSWLDGPLGANNGLINDTGWWFCVTCNKTLTASESLSREHAMHRVEKRRPTTSNGYQELRRRERFNSFLVEIGAQLDQKQQDEVWRYVEAARKGEL